MASTLLLAPALTVGCAGSEDRSVAPMDEVCSDVDRVLQSVDRVGDTDVRENGVDGLASALGVVLDDLVVLHASGREQLAVELDAIDAVEQGIRATVDDPSLDRVADVLVAAASLANRTTTLIGTCG